MNEETEESFIISISLTHPDGRNRNLSSIALPEDAAEELAGLCEAAGTALEDWVRPMRPMPACDRSLLDRISIGKYPFDSSRIPYALLRKAGPNAGA